MPERRNTSALTTWHSQLGLLWVSWTWGLSYMVPGHYRIAFSEVYPHLAGPMWAWGAALIFFATTALVSERFIRHSSYKPWVLAWGAHMVLAGIYATLSAAALVEALGQVHGPWLISHTFHLGRALFHLWLFPTTEVFWGNVISAASRTVLWGLIGYWHTTFARLPRFPA